MCTMDTFDRLGVVKVLESLKRFQSSTKDHERNILRCTIKEILEKRMFFPAYPNDQLMKMAHMFGGIINYGLMLNDEDLNVAYDFIFDALNKSPNTKMFSFGIIALDQIKHILFRRREYCDKISTIPHLNHFPPELIKYINSGKNPQKKEKYQLLIETLRQDSPEIYKLLSSITTDNTEPDTPIKPINTDAISSFEPFIANSAPSERTAAVVSTTRTNDQKTMMIPPENVEQKIAFIFNNLSQENVKEKCVEVKEVLKRIYLPWFSVFLSKRIGNEIQYHSLYINCLEYFNSEPLNQLIELEIVKNIKILFLKDKSLQTKNLLKNLGHWLGLLTLTKEKPVPFNLEEMLIEANGRGNDELTFILPFVAKILESCSKSKLYGPETSWTMSVLNHLAEIHRTPGLKLNSQFEIELLFKTLNVELKCVDPGKRKQIPEKVQELIQIEPQETSKMPKPLSVTTTVSNEPSLPIKVLNTNAVTSSEPLIANSAPSERTAAELTKRQYDDEKTLISPPENVQMKMIFIFNTLSQNNVQNKCVEVKEVLKRIYLPWFSEFLTKRISNEFHLHSLYFKCLEYFKSSQLNELIELDIVKKIKILLMKVKTPQRKTMLKNLGHWLGLLTLTKDKPVPLNLEAILFDAYVKGTRSDDLMFIISFVSNILESCDKSKVYGPKSLWTMSVLNFLSELYQKPGLKLHSRFEIERLFKMLNVELKEFPACKFLKM